MSITPVLSPMPAPLVSSHALRRSRAPAACTAAVLLLTLAGCGGGGGSDDTGFTVGGVVSGLAEGRSLVLQNQGADDLAVSANGSFVMGRRLETGSAYAIAVASQPAGQRCSVAQGTGTVQAASVADLAVRCETLAAGTHTVGGSVTGLQPGKRVVLQNNQGDDLEVAANGRFLFATALANGSAYAVRVRTQPAGQVCTLANAGGTVAGAHVQSLQVNCATTTWALPQGDWTGEYCNPMFPHPSTLTHLRITRQSETATTLVYGQVVFATPDCSGHRGVYPDGTQTEVTTFERQESRGDLTAFWGTQMADGGSNPRVVWVRKGEYLCRLYPDLRSPQPTDYTTLDNVEQGTARAIERKQCFRPTVN